MARCNCGSQTCSCVVTAGANVTVTGSGSAADPLVVSADPASGSPATIPPGVVWMWGGSSTPPIGWLLCDGTTVDQVTFGALYAVIGDDFGPAPAGQFRLPPSPGRYPVGIDDNHPKEGGGDATVSLTLANVPVHAHSITHTHDINHSHGSPNSDPGGGHQHHVPGFNLEGPDGTHHHTVTGAGGHNHAVADVVGSNLSFRRGDGPGTEVVSHGGHEHSTTGENSQHVHHIDGHDTGNADPNTHFHNMPIPMTSGKVSDTSNTANTGGTGGSTPVPISPPFVGFYFIIKT